MDRNQPKSVKEEKKDYEYGGNEKQRYSDFNGILRFLKGNGQHRNIVGDVKYVYDEVEDDEIDDEEIVEEEPQNKKANIAYKTQGLGKSSSQIEKKIKDCKCAFTSFGLTDVDLSGEKNGTYILADPRFLAGKKYATFSDFYRLDVNADGEYSISKIGFDDTLPIFHPEYNKLSSYRKKLCENDVLKSIFGFKNVELYEKMSNQPDKEEAKNEISAEDNYKALTDGTLYNEFVEFAKKNHVAVNAETKEDFYDNLRAKSGSAITPNNASDGKFLFVDPRVRTGALNPEDPSAAYYIVTKSSPNAKPKFEKISFDKMVDFAEDNTLNKIKRPHRGFFGTIRDWFGKNNKGREEYEAKKQEYLSAKYHVLEHKFGVKNLDYSAVNGGKIEKDINKNVENQPLVPGENKLPDYDTALDKIDTIIKYCSENNVADNIRVGAENIKAYLVSNQHLNAEGDELSRSDIPEAEKFKNIVSFLASGEKENAALMVMEKQGFCEAVGNGMSKYGIHDVDTITKNVVESFGTYSHFEESNEKTRAEVEQRKKEEEAKEEAFSKKAIEEAKKAVAADVTKNEHDIEKYVNDAKTKASAFKQGAAKAGAEAVKTFFEKIDPQLQTEAGKNITYYLNTMTEDQRRSVLGYIPDALKANGIDVDASINRTTAQAYENAINSAFEKAAVDDAHDMERAKNSLSDEMSESQAPANFESKIKKGATDALDEIIAKSSSPDAKLGAEKIKGYIEKDPDMKTEDCRRIVNYFASPKVVEQIGINVIHTTDIKFVQFCENVGKLANHPKATGNKMIDGILNVKVEPHKNSEYTKLIEDKAEKDNLVHIK